jgi:hypothetical protein
MPFSSYEFMFVFVVPLALVGMLSCVLAAKSITLLG